MSIEYGNLRRGMIRGGATMAIVAAMFGVLPRSTSAEGQDIPVSADCLREVPLLAEAQRACNGYVNGGQNSLWGYYKAGNSLESKNIFLRVAAIEARHHLDTRIFPPARIPIIDKVSHWPEGPNKVNQEVHFVDMDLQRSKKRAFIKTLESWSVRHDGKELLSFSETKPHIVWHTLCYAKQRILPGINKLKLYEEWLVTDKFRNTRRNCAAFAGKLVTGQIK